MRRHCSYVHRNLEQYDLDMTSNKPTPALFWVVLAAMLLGVLATALGLHSHSGNGLVLSVLLLLGQLALAAFCVVMLIRARGQS